MNHITKQIHNIKRKERKTNIKTQIIYDTQKPNSKESPQKKTDKTKLIFLNKKNYNLLNPVPFFSNNHNA